MAVSTSGVQIGVKELYYHLPIFQAALDFYDQHIIVLVPVAILIAVIGRKGSICRVSTKLRDERRYSQHIICHTIPYSA